MRYKVQTKVLSIIIFLSLLIGCSQNQYFAANENTEMWIAICDNKDIYYQTPIENNRNGYFKISNNLVENIEDGYIFSIYADGNDIYYAENYTEADTEIKYIPYGSTEPQVLFSVDREKLSRMYREYLYKNSDSLFYNTIHGTLYEYKLSTDSLIKRLENTNCSLILGNEIFYADMSGTIYKNNLNFDNQVEILNTNDIFNSKIRKKLNIYDNNTITGSVVRLGAYKNKLYFTFSRYYKDSPGMMFTCNMDGTHIQLITICSDKNIEIGQFQFYNDNIYFLGCTEDNTGVMNYYKMSLYKMSLNGKDIELIDDIENAQSFYIHDNCIYYSPDIDSDETLQYKLYIYNLETSQKSEIKFE